MATTISRAWLNAQVDDDGSGETGSIIDKGDFTSIYNAIDAIFAGAVQIGSYVAVNNAPLVNPLTVRIAPNTNFGVMQSGSTAAIGGHDDSFSTWQSLVVNGSHVFTSAGRLGVGTLSPASLLSNTSVNITDGFGQGMAAVRSLRWEVAEDGYAVGIQQASTSGAALGLLIKTAANGGQRTLCITAGGQDRFVVTANGNTVITGDGVAPLTVDGTHGSGAFLAVKAALANVGFFGSTPAMGLGGAVTDAALYAPIGRLVLEGALGVYSNSIAAVVDGTANVSVNATTLRLTRAASSLRYKADVRPLNGWRWLLDLAPISFTARANRCGRRFGGLAAEDVAAKCPRGEDGTPMYAGLNAHGAPEDVLYDHFAAPLVLAVQEFERRLAALEGKG